MKTAKVLTTIANVYATLFAFLYLGAATFTLATEGIRTMFSIYFNPFNAVNFILVIAVLSPALILYIVAGRLQKRHEKVDAFLDDPTRHS